MVTYFFVVVFIGGCCEIGVIIGVGIVFGFVGVGDVVRFICFVTFIGIIVVCDECVFMDLWIGGWRVFLGYKECKVVIVVGVISFVCVVTIIIVFFVFGCAYIVVAVVVVLIVLGFDIIGSIVVVAVVIWCFIGFVVVVGGLL